MKFRKFGLGLVASLTIWVCVGSASPVARSFPALGQPQWLRAGEVHTYEVKLEAGDFFYLLVEQEGVDLFLRWSDPEGTEIRVIDSPTGAYDQEELIVGVASTGVHYVEVVAFGEISDAEPEGLYVFLEVATRPPTAQDRAQLAVDAEERRGLQLIAEGRLAEAEPVLRRVLKRWEVLGFERRVANTLARLGRLGSRMDDAVAAREAYDAAAQIYRKLGAWRRLSLMLLNGARFHLDLGDPESALRRTREALPLFEIRQTPDGVVFAALTLARQGIAHLQLGKLQSAIGDLRQALERIRPTGRREIEATILAELSGIELDLDRLDDAYRHARSAERIFRGQGAVRELALVLRKMAAASARLGNLEEAERLSREALDNLPLKEGSERARILGGLAHVLRHRGRLESAQVAFESALKQVEGQSDSRTRAILLTGLGHLLGRRGEASRGLLELRRAGRLFDQLGDLDGQAMSFARSAELLHQLGRFDAAWESIAEALDRVEQVRGSLLRQDLRLSFFGLRQDYYEIALEILSSLHRREPLAGYALRALAVHDRRLSRELLEHLSTPKGSGEVPEVLEREQLVEARVREMARAPWHAARAAQLAAVLEELEAVRGELRRPSGDMDSVESVPINRLDGESLAVDLLDADTLLLVYSLGTEKSRLWSASLEKTAGGQRLRFQAHDLPSRRVIERLCLGLLKFSSWRSKSRSEIDLFTRDLTNILLKPVAEELDDRRLVLVVDGALRLLPFAMLPRPGGVPSSADREPFLVERHEIVQLPSLTVLRGLRRRAAELPRDRRRVAVFSDPVFSSVDPRLQATEVSDRILPGGPDVSMSFDFEGDFGKRLEATADESQALLKLVEPEDRFHATGFEASRETVLAALPNYQVLHFATHAFLHPRPELSGLVLSQWDKKGRPRDGFVRLFEIARLSLSADLVVLSACETQVGPNVRGEGAQGLAWGFFQAGAERVISTLWKVRDRPTAEVMKEFYEAHLVDGLTPASALRRAQLRILRRRGSLPYDWAGFIYQGDWRDPRPFRKTRP